MSQICDNGPVRVNDVCSLVPRLLRSSFFHRCETAGAEKPGYEGTICVVLAFYN